MAAFSEMHIAADRFAQYIDELREFSGTYRVPCGKPEDLAKLIETLRNSQVFAADFGSMIRSIDLREQFQESESDLLTLVAVAWGGVKADDSLDPLPPVTHELGKILRESLRRGGSEPSIPPAPDSKELTDVSPGVDETIRELEQISADVQMYRQLLKFQDSKEERQDASPNSVSGQRRASGQNGEPNSSGGAPAAREHVPPSENFLFQKASERFLIEEETRDKPVDLSGPDSSDDSGGIFSTRWLEPSAVEIFATALTGLVAALLLSVGSLPVYRARVSVYLPSPIAGTTNANDRNAASSASHEASRELTEKVAERLLVRPHANPILRQDALSRGMRDLNLGGRETILYANLVSETSHQVNVRHLESQNLYEITCDSWSPQFAATFCNEVIRVLEEQPSDAISSQSGPESVRTVDAAVGPGIQIYPRWYLQSVAGLGVGCMVGMLLGFVKRPTPEAIHETDNQAL